MTRTPLQPAPDLKVGDDDDASGPPLIEVMAREEHAPIAPAAPRRRTEEAEAPLSEEPFAVSRAPWAMMLAIALLAAFEFGVRSMPPADAIPYQNTGRQSYSAVRNYLAAEGPARVSFMGSSRGREAIMAPVVRESLKAALGRHVTVANYSSPAASADENEQLLRIMLRQEKKPQIVLLGMSPLQLSESALKTDHAGELWYLEDWWREGQYQSARQSELRERMRAADDRDERRRIFRQLQDPFQRDVLPEIIRNEIGLRYKTFGYRERASNFFATLFSDEKFPPCPLHGQLSESQRKKKQRSLAEKPVTVRRVRDYLSKRMEGGRYPLGGRQTEHLHSICRQCNDAGVLLVLYELPLSQILKDNYPPGTLEACDRIITQVASEHGIEYVRLDELGLSFTDADFREQSHMNNTGATKLSEALATQVIAPIVRR